MYRVSPMPTQQNTTLPLGLPTSEKDMITRPVCRMLSIFPCDSLCAWMKVSTPRSMLSGAGRALFRDGVLVQRGVPARERVGSLDARAPFDAARQIRLGPALPLRR